SVWRGPAGGRAGLFRRADDHEPARAGAGVSSARGARRVLVACVMCLGLLEGLPGCGGHAPAVSRTIPTTGGGSAPASWAAQTQALCRQKRAAIARLGYINITY